MTCFLSFPCAEADGKANPEDKPGSTYLVFEYLQYDLAGLVESGMRYGDFTTF